MTRRTFVSLASSAAILAGCNRSSTKLRLALNWKPDPEFGGFYAAPYRKNGLEVEILPGGAGTPTVQMIGAGSVEFGIVSGDELLLARARGNDVVALFATFQNCPQCIMVHSSRHLETIADLMNSGGTLAIQSGLPYARILETKYGFKHMKVVPSPGGDVSAFVHDEMFAQQCFVMDEPLTARAQGVGVQVFPVSDIGYNPYTTVLAVSGEMLKQNPDRAKALVAAVRDGWWDYLANPSPTNQTMHALNPSMDAQTFADVAVAEKPYIEIGEAGKAALGTMTKDRWQTLAQQLREVGDIPDASVAGGCFELF